MRRVRSEESGVPGRVPAERRNPFPDACRYCPIPPDPNLVACQRTMPCPNPPDRRVRACRPPGAVIEGPVFGHVLKIEAIPDGLIVMIGVGSYHGIAKDWSGVILIGDTTTPLAGGEIVIVRIDKHLTVGKVHLTTGQLGPNQRVRLTRNGTADRAITN